MAKEELKLKELSIAELFSGGEQRSYEIPIYQRNYAWEKDEIEALIHDIYDAYKSDPKRPYYIGTLVSYHRGDQVYEIIDGQQRLTTLRLIMDALDIKAINKLTYRARKKADNTLNPRSAFNIDDDNEEKDKGIVNGYKYVVSAIADIVSSSERYGFVQYFKDFVHIIHYQVPRDIDLNHYFEIMNSRGEQLEKHEIEKAKLMELLEDDDERRAFNRIWECCSEMSVYVQQNLEDMNPSDVFGASLCEFLPKEFTDLVINYLEKKEDKKDDKQNLTIREIIKSDKDGKWAQLDKTDVKKDSFLPIIDFPNFLLIVLKLTRMAEPDFLPDSFKLDDKELLNEFQNAKMDSQKVRLFAYNLLKARFFLDNYVVHHSKEEDSMDSNPWKLQVWHKDPDTKKGQLKNLSNEDSIQDSLVHLLSMFEVSFTARQRKNYLFYTLLYLLKNGAGNLQEYADFTENLADRFFNKVYLDKGKLNEINTPLPGSFDEVMLTGNALSESPLESKPHTVFAEIYGDGTEESKGVPLFVFNYLDYKIWKKYNSDIRGNDYKEKNRERQEFFRTLGCGDFGLTIFDQFYFSRTRRSLEHYYPQANVKDEKAVLTKDQINCFGNYAMIGSEANSSASNWSPLTKLSHYQDSSRKINQISIASLKFMIMMKICRDHQCWEYAEIKDHQDKMVALLMDS